MGKNITRKLARPPRPHAISSEESPISITETLFEGERTQALPVVRLPRGHRSRFHTINNVRIQITIVTRNAITTGTIRCQPQDPMVGSGGEYLIHLPEQPRRPHHSWTVTDPLLDTVKITYARFPPRKAGSVTPVPAPPQ